MRLRNEFKAEKWPGEVKRGTTNRLKQQNVFLAIPGTKSKEVTIEDLGA